MPRRAKGPRLYLRTGRTDRRTGKPLPDVWVIRDGTYEGSTGCGPGEQQAAERALGDYLASKFKAPQLKADSRRDPGQVLVAEVVALYSQDKAATSKLDAPTFDRFVANLLGWWGDRTLVDVKRSTCQAYAAHRMSQPDARYKDPAKAPRVSSETARRELEILSAAIGHWHGEDTLTTRPVVWLPDKPESPRDALTRSQAAALLKAAMGYRKTATGWERLGGSAIANRAHLRRFILIGLYTGTRHSAMRALLWEEALTQAWVDLDKGMIYRRGRGERETTKRRPVVKLPRRLLAHMRRWRRLDLSRKPPKSNTSGEPVRNAYTSVLHHGGGPIAGKIRTGFEGCVRDAGLPPEVTPHWMRHTAATWLMEGGVDMWEAAAYLGMSVATLEKHYGHHRPDHQAAATRAIGGKR
jgi:integrase